MTVNSLARYRPHEYKLLKAYHTETGSTDPNYWENLQRRASAQGAPLDVVFEIYEKPGEWVRLNDLHDAELRTRVLRASR